MKRKAFLATAISAVLLAGCGATTSSTTDPTQNGTQPGQTGGSVNSSDADLDPSAVMAANANYTVTPLDEWEASEAVDVLLRGNTAESASATVSVSDSTVTISQEGVYRLQGTLAGQVRVDAPDEALVVLILDGAEISSVSGAAIEVVSADDVVIHLAEGSTNVVTDTATYPADADANAAIYSKEDLTISGDGSLVVEAKANDGITSKDDLVILGGTITVTAEDDALRGKDSLVVEGGNLTLVARGGDGMTSDGDEGDDEIDWTRGFIYIIGGQIDITAGDDGIQAFTDTVIVGGTTTVDAVDDGVKAEVVVSIGELSGIEPPRVTVTNSEEAIEAANIGISGGIIDVTASDDGINASGNAELQALMSGTEYSAGGRDEFMDTGERLEISGGVLTVDAEGDGLDSNGSLTISGGDITIYGPTRGGNGSLDSDGTMTLTGGTLVAFGPGSMEQTPDAGDQGWVLLSAQMPAGTTATLTDEGGSTLAEFTSRKSATTVIYSSPEIAKGDTFSLLIGGQSAGSAIAGEGGFGGPGGMGGGPGRPGGPGGPGGPGRPGR